MKGGAPPLCSGGTSSTSVGASTSSSPAPTSPRTTIHYGESRVRVPQSLSDHMYPRVDLLLMESNPTKVVSPRLSYKGSGIVLAHALEDVDDPWFGLMQYESLTKGFEHVPNTPHHRLMATWLWDMISFTFEMTFNEVLGWRALARD